MKAAIRYQLAEAKQPLLIYYSIILTLLFISLMINSVRLGLSVNGVAINGIEVTSMIFIFIAGLNSFKDTFRMFMQNGRSRKTLFISYIYSLLPICGGMALIDTSFGLLGKWVQGYQSAFNQFYGASFSGAYAAVQAFAAGIFWSFTAYSACALTGYFITILFYRMNKNLKLLVSIGIPVFLLIVLPVVDISFAQGAIAKGIANLFLLASGAKAGVANPLYPIISNLILTIILSGCSFLLMRRSVIQDRS